MALVIQHEAVIERLGVKQEVARHIADYTRELDAAYRERDAARAEIKSLRDGADELLADHEADLNALHAARAEIEALRKQLSALTQACGESCASEIEALKAANKILLDRIDARCRCCRETAECLIDPTPEPSI